MYGNHPVHVGALRVSYENQSKFPSQVWHLAGRVAQRLSGSVLAVAIDDGPYLALAELAAWRRSFGECPLHQST